MKKLKDETIREYTIRIDRVREREGDKYEMRYIDKMFLVNIKDSCGGGIAFGVKITENYKASIKRCFKKIMEELHLN